MSPSTFLAPAAYIHLHSCEACESGAAAGSRSLSAARQQTRWLVKINQEGVTRPILFCAETDRVGKVFDQNWKEEEVISKQLICDLSWPLFFVQQVLKLQTRSFVSGSQNGLCVLWSVISVVLVWLCLGSRNCSVEVKERWRSWLKETSFDRWRQKMKHGLLCQSHFIIYSDYVQHQHQVQTNLYCPPGQNMNIFAAAHQNLFSVIKVYKGI